MATAAVLIATALELAGNTSIAQSTCLTWLNNFLQAEYRRKYSWQRKTITIPVGGGVADYPGAWDATFLDVYMQRDMSVGRYTLSNQVFKLYQLAYREWIAKADRLSASGNPTRLVADQVGLAWHVWPVPTASLSVTVDIYTLPPLLAIGDTPLWSTYGPDEILVQALKVYALDHQDDQRMPAEKVALYGDQKQSIPGMLATYRRRTLAEEGISSTTAQDQTKYLPMEAET